MNEEEKQAMEFLKTHIIPLYKEGKIELLVNETILNLIEKQQQKIEELDKENTRQQELIGNIHQKWKDKIREKIEELENTYDENNKNDYHNQFIVDCVAIIEELLSGQESDQEGGQEDE